MVLRPHSVRPRNRPDGSRGSRLVRNLEDAITADEELQRVAWLKPIGNQPSIDPIAEAAKTCPIIRDLYVITMSEQTGSRWMMNAAERAAQEILQLRTALHALRKDNGDD